MTTGAVPGSKPASIIGRLFADGRAPLIWGVVWGVIQAAVPLGFWWLDPATVYALSLALIAAVYIGFAVADGRRAVIAVECAVAGAFVVLAAAAITGPAAIDGIASGEPWQSYWQKTDQSRRKASSWANGHS